MLSVIPVSRYLKNISIRLVQSAKWYEIGSSGAVNSPALVAFFLITFSNIYFGFIDYFQQQ